MTTNAAGRAPGAEEACACSALRQASRVVTRLYDGALKPVGLQATQFPVLVAVARLGPVSQSVLAETLGMDRTTLTRNLQPLVRDDLLRVTAGTDRRVRVVEVTRRGRGALARARPRWASAQATLTSRVGADRIDRLVRELTATIAHLEDTRTA